MIAQLTDFKQVDAPATCTHLVTLLGGDGDERSLTVTTETNAFVEVYRQICWMRAEMGLNGYQIFETLELQAPF